MTTLTDTPPAEKELGVQQPGKQSEITRLAEIHSGCYTFDGRSLRVVALSANECTFWSPLCDADMANVSSIACGSAALNFQCCLFSLLDRCGGKFLVRSR